MRTDIKQKRADIVFKIKVNFRNLLLSNSETGNEISKTHAENKLKYISIRSILWNALCPWKETETEHPIWLNQSKTI